MKGDLSWVVKQQHRRKNGLEGCLAGKQEDLATVGYGKEYRQKLG